MAKMLSLCGRFHGRPARIHRRTCSRATDGIVHLVCRRQRKANHTSGPLIAMKLMHDSVASALAVSVFEHPGGPYNRTPFGGLTPNRSNVAGWRSGHSTHSFSFCLTTAWPPMSDHRTCGVSINTSRRALGRIEVSAERMSERVSTVWTSPEESEERCRLIASVPASRMTAPRSAPTYPCVRAARDSSSVAVRACGVLDSRTLRIASLAVASGIPEGTTSIPEHRAIVYKSNLPISISRSNLPGRRRAGSIALGLFVVATTMTLSLTCSPMPSISVKRVATTLFSTSPPAPSSLLGQRASTSSTIMTQGLFSLASRNRSRNFASVSPWYADARLGPEIASIDECVEAATARAR